jgi:DHA1 family bicyclomycin/chloramphenicol resistance-like MFS transporter
MSGWRLIAVLSTLMAFASISTDLFLPALPSMAVSLHAEAGTLELAISSFLVGFSLGQLFWGPISDRYGRKAPTAAGLVLFVFGSVGCAMSGTTDALIGWRLVQALGASASVVLARAMVRDLHGGKRAAEMMSTLMAIMAVAPLLGPVVGGQILALGGWRTIFYSLAAIGVATLVAVLTMPETLPAERRRPSAASGIIEAYSCLARDRRVLRYAGAAGFFYGGTFAYVAASPFAYISLHQVSPQAYGLLFGAGILGIMACTTANRRLVGRLGSNRLLVWGTAVAALASVALAATAWTGFGGLAGLVIPMFLFVSVTGVIGANAVTGVLAEHPDRAGAASAMFGAIQYGGGILGSAVVGWLSDGTAAPMGTVVAIGGLGCFLCVGRLRSAKC